MGRAATNTLSATGGPPEVPGLIRSAALRICGHTIELGDARKAGVIAHRNGKTARCVLLAVSPASQQGDAFDAVCRAVCEAGDCKLAGACRDQSVKISRIRERLKAEAKKPLVIPAPSAPRQRTAEDMCKDEEMWAGIRRAKAARLARR